MQLGLERELGGRAEQYDAAGRGRAPPVRRPPQQVRVAHPLAAVAGLPRAARCGAEHVYRAARPSRNRAMLRAPIEGKARARARGGERACPHTHTHTRARAPCALPRRLVEIPHSARAVIRQGGRFERLGGAVLVYALVHLVGGAEAFELDHESAISTDKQHDRRGEAEHERDVHDDGRRAARAP